MTRRTYSDDERAIALAMLAANNGNTKRTSRDLGIAESTLRCWSDGTRHPEARADAGAVMPQLADAFEAIARRLLAAVTDEKLAEVNVVAMAKCAGIATDKLLLLNGSPTVIVAGDDYGSLSDAELDARIAEAEERQRRRVG